MLHQFKKRNIFMIMSLFKKLLKLPLDQKLKVNKTLKDLNKKLKTMSPEEVRKMVKDELKKNK